MRACELLIPAKLSAWRFYRDYLVSEAARLKNGQFDRVRNFLIYAHISVQRSEFRRDGRIRTEPLNTEHSKN